LIGLSIRAPFITIKKKLAGRKYAAGSGILGLIPTFKVFAWGRV